MINDVKAAFTAYSEKPFLFMWGSVLYVFFLLVFLLSAIGIAMIGLMAAFILNVNITTDSPFVLGLGAVLVLYYLFVSSGVTAALINSYSRAMAFNSTNLLDFYHYALSKALLVFGIGLMWDLANLVLIGPVAALYFLVYLKDYEPSMFVDGMFYIYVLLILFITHFVTFPMVVSASLGKSPFESFRSAYFALRSRHMFLLLLFICLCLTMLLNLVPVVQFISLFFLLPVVLASLIKMVTSSS
ncbi:Uncharacterised protein [uncultured archaeon]|nr:Uncharacterised protein [uncultured archaeon]